MKTSPFKKVIQNLPFHNFEENSEFYGIYKSTIELGEEEKFNANVFTDVTTGEEIFVTDTYLINKAIKSEMQKTVDLSQTVFHIQFIEKTMVKNKPFNKFDIEVCTLSEYEEFMKK